MQHESVLKPHPPVKRMLEYADAVLLSQLLPHYPAAVKRHTKLQTYPQRTLEYQAQRRVLACGGGYIYYLQAGRLHSLDEQANIRSYPFAHLLTAILATDYCVILLDTQGQVYTCQHGEWGSATYDNQPLLLTTNVEHMVISGNKLICYRNRDKFVKTLTVSSTSPPFSELKRFSSCDKTGIAIDMQDELWWQRGRKLQSLVCSPMPLDCACNKELYAVLHVDATLRVYRNDQVLKKLTLLSERLSPPSHV